MIFNSISTVAMQIGVLQQFYGIQFEGNYNFLLSITIFRRAITRHVRTVTVHILILAFPSYVDENVRGDGEGGEATAGFLQQDG